MKGDTSISGKRIIEESLVKASGKWVGEVFQDGLRKNTRIDSRSKKLFTPL
jgi:hypothetical protein